MPMKSCRPKTSGSARNYDYLISSLAIGVGITQANMSNIVNGKTNPSLKTLEEIAKVLQVAVWELFTASTLSEELIVLINHRGDFYKANSISELEEIVEKIKGKR